MRRAIVYLALLLAACDPVVSERRIGEPETRRYNDTEYQMGFCYTCMPGFDGKLSCGAKLSSYCPVTVEKDGVFVRVEQTHESGRVDTMWSGPLTTTEKP